jgi:hypothetical protein
MGLLRANNFGVVEPCHAQQYPRNLRGGILGGWAEEDSARIARAVACRKLVDFLCERAVRTQHCPPAFGWTCFSPVRDGRRPAGRQAGREESL